MPCQPRARQNIFCFDRDWHIPGMASVNVSIEMQQRILDRPVLGMCMAVWCGSSLILHFFAQI